MHEQDSILESTDHDSIIASYQNAGYKRRLEMYLQFPKLRMAFDRLEHTGKQYCIMVNFVFFKVFIESPGFKIGYRPATLKFLRLGSSKSIPFAKEYS